MVVSGTNTCNNLWDQNLLGIFKFVNFSNNVLNYFFFLLVATEFLQKLSAVQKAHSQQLSNLVTAFKKKAQEVKKIS